MVDFGKSDKMIKISEKVDKPTLTTDFRIKNEISMLNLLSMLIYPLFH